MTRQPFQAKDLVDLINHEFFLDVKRQNVSKNRMIISDVGVTTLIEVISREPNSLKGSRVGRVEGAFYLTGDHGEGHTLFDGKYLFMLEEVHFVSSEISLKGKVAWYDLRTNKRQPYFEYPVDLSVAETFKYKKSGTVSIGDRYWVQEKSF